MSRHRLAVVDETIARMIGDASPDDCRQIARGVAELASRGITEPRVQDARAALERGEYGASATRDRIEALVDEWDQEGWRFQEAGREDEYLAAFTRARAASSLWFALGDDPTAAALEAAYEAQASVDDIGAVRALVAKVCEPKGQ
jgi:hypothetical protein